MAVQKTTEKRRKNLLSGTEGKPFSADNQPPAEAKILGWKKRRAERLLTQAILSHMTNGQNMTDYVTSLFKNAKKGNAKAIETINKGVEDEVLKVSQTDSDGNDIILNKLSETDLKLLLALKQKAVD
jgi:hypothetical protein